MHNGPSTQTGRSAACCGSEPQVVALTGDASPGRRVQLVRCRECGRSSWLVDGAAADQGRALAALSDAFASPTSRRAAPQGRGGVRAAAGGTTGEAPGRDLADLLAGWKVLGATD